MEQKTTNSHLQRKRQKLTEKRDALLRSFSKVAVGGKRKRLEVICKQICQMNDFLQSLDLIEAETGPKQATTTKRYVVSSLFLHESFKKLTADRDEQFFFITGSETDGALVLDQMLEFAHKKRTIGGVEGDERSTHRLLIKLSQFGHRLLGHFHSHPGHGVQQTRPSGTDENFQRRLENAGHVAVAAIFSRDGYVRFWRLDNSVEIQIHGTGVEQHEQNVYRLTKIDQP